jgi:FkbM family methyltransferase
MSFNVLRRCRYGLMLVNANDVYIGASLSQYGEWCQLELDLCRQVLQPGDVVLDVGANIGSHTLAFADAVGPAGVVHAFEPQRVVFQTLCANVALNSLTHVVTHQVALGEQPGTVRIPPLDYARLNNYGGVSLDNSTEGEPVPRIRLDDLELAACKLIKVDVEGMEAQVLRGARATIEHLKPLLYVENDRKDRLEELLDTLEALGYAMYQHSVPCYNPHNFNNNPVNTLVIEDRPIYSYNLLCVPAGSPIAVQGLPQLMRQPPG